ncbi:hypothetical protein A2U01_0103070, partial [Trifolium medium]|nr:hypothetical protein [Trifolium medium]
MVEETSPMKAKKKAKKTKSQVEEVISPSKTITEETSSKPKGKKSKKKKSHSSTDKPDSIPSA